MSTELVKADGSGAMFDRIAHRYDLLNRLMSFGLDRSWRTQLMKAMPSDGRILDVATGTADVAIAMAEKQRAREVIGLDPSRGMLDVGDIKIQKRTLTERVTLVQGDAQDMDFPDDHFAGATIAFGIRNVPDRLQGLREMTRVVEPGGPVAVLELSEPQGGLMAPLARFHVHHFVPLMGWLLSGRKEYRYLQTSVAAFPPARDFARMMEDAGLKDVQVKRMSFGVAHLYIGRA